MHVAVDHRRQDEIALEVDGLSRGRARGHTDTGDAAPHDGDFAVPATGQQHVGQQRVERRRAHATLPGISAHSRHVIPWSRSPCVHRTSASAHRTCSRVGLSTGMIIGSEL